MTERNPKIDILAAQKTVDLLQELVWAIQSRPADEVKTGLRFLEDSVRTANAAHSNRFAKKARGREHLTSLIGSMPLILADLELFPSNESIAKFAAEALGIHIARWEKRSRYEMIGMLVMETSLLSETRVRELANFLAEVNVGGKRLASIKRAVSDVGFSWNEAIRSLSGKGD
ncbi:MAG: hypothetical protein WBW32_06940 [Luteibacter sp.]